jgi:hypothetical protein
VRSQIFGGDGDGKSALILVLDRQNKVLDIVSVYITGCTGQGQIGLETCTALLYIGSFVAGTDILCIGSTGVEDVWKNAWGIVVGRCQRRLQRECWRVLRFLSCSAELIKVLIPVNITYH